jgi:hypothetical protein
VSQTDFVKAKQYALSAGTAAHYLILQYEMQYCESTELQAAAAAAAASTTATATANLEYYSAFEQLDVSHYSCAIIAGTCST